MFSRSKIGDAAQEFTDHIKLVDNVKALQQGQKEISDALYKLDERLRMVEIEMKSLKPEIKLEALREAQNVVWAVQNSFNDRIQDLAVKVGVLEHKPLLNAPSKAENFMKNSLASND